MPFRRVICLLAMCLLASCALSSPALTVTATPPETLKLEQIGKGTAPLDGKWQFHLGDDPLWAEPATDDTAGQNGWEEITADAPWGQQGHNGYSGIAWYRRHIEVSPAQGASPDSALHLRTIDDAYELYWNGVLIGSSGKFPPHPHGTLGAPPSTYGLGPIHSGVLAIRVWRGPPASNEDGSVGGLRSPPILGSPQAIAALHDQGMFRWLRARQFSFGLTFLYMLVAVLSLITWLRNRPQWLFFWMAIYAVSPALELLLGDLGLPIRLDLATMLVQVQIQVREISQWFVLLFLLQLDDSKKLRKFLTWLAVFTLIGGTLDGMLAFFYDTVSAATVQWTDAVLTFLILPQESIPAILVAYALFRRKKLDSARWVVAIFATSAALNYAISNISQQGVRFTHWPLADWMGANLFTINGNNFNAQLILRTLLFLAILYSVTRYAIEYRRRQNSLEQEFQNARELQQVLIPETLPELPGYAVTSSYRPAQEVGGDFFQIIELEGEDYGSTLIVLGDVSGKGLKAAMTVALIVGALRTLVETSSSPGDILAGLNRRLYGRMQDGFATCIALRITPDGKCFLASAGHPAPYHNLREVDLPGALPLGLVPAVYYEEIFVHLREGDQFSLYTDGLLEARNANGEIFSFERLEALFADQPDAVRASDAAVAFGQDDDITVLTLTRLGQGQEPTITVTLPRLTRLPA